MASRAWLSVALVGMAGLLGPACGSTAPSNGKLACAPVGAARRCPEGFECRADDRCWQPGTGPGVVSTPDGGRADTGSTIGYDAALPQDAPVFVPMPSRPNPSGFRQVPGGQVSSSPTYRIVGTAPPPPGVRFMESKSYRLVGGIVGATQK
jgi:hypothetical protein